MDGEINSSKRDLVIREDNTRMWADSLRVKYHDLKKTCLKLMDENLALKKQIAKESSE